MKHPAIIIDVDDTLADTQAHMLRWINARSERQYIWEELNQSFREGNELEYDGYVQQLLAKREHMEGIEPYSDAVRAMRRLYEAGYELHVVSSRREHLFDLTQDWLREHGFADFITQVHRRGDERGTAFKVRIAREIGALAAFDDTYDVAAAMASAGVTVYLIDKPWNQNVALGERLHRSASFASAVATFLEYTK